MPDTVLDVGRHFPAGTSVNAYKEAEADERCRSGSVPDGLAARDTATVAADTSLTFTGLASGERYLAHAEVDGQQVYLAFSGT